MSTVLHLFLRPTRLISMRNCWCLIKPLTITITILVLAGRCPWCWIYWAALPIKKENSDLFVQQNSKRAEKCLLAAGLRVESLWMFSAQTFVSRETYTKTFSLEIYIFLRSKTNCMEILSRFKVILDQDKKLRSTVLHVENWSHQAGARQTKWLLHSHQCYKKQHKRLLHMSCHNGGSQNTWPPLVNLLSPKTHFTWLTCLASYTTFWEGTFQIL